MKGERGPRRRRRGTALPRKKDEVPAWLASTYGVPLVDGEPVLEGLAAATVRAESILENRRLLWREKIRSLRKMAREAPMAKRNAMRLEAARAEVAMREGKRYPHASVIARSEFLIMLDVHRDQYELSFLAFCVLAWWRGLLPGDPGDVDLRRETRRLMKRHW